MAKNKGQLSKLFTLARILQYETKAGEAEDHSDYIAFSEAELEKKLHDKGIKVERKTVYKDLDLLRAAGMDIEMFRIGRTYYYCCTSLPYGFEFTDLEILVDAIQSAKFISESQSAKIIKSITGICNKYDRAKLDRSVAITGRIKSKRGSSLYNIDKIHAAIADNKQIAFDYYKWAPDKKLVKKQEKKYVVSPIALIYENERYYLVAYSYDAVSDSMKQKNYRVDKMKATEILEEERDASYDYASFNPAKYINTTFNMFGSDESETVSLRVQNDCVGIFIDKFGEDISVSPIDDLYCQVEVVVKANEQFYGWLSGISKVAKITAPEIAVDSFKKYLTDILTEY